MSKSKAKGTQYESKIAAYVNQWCGYDVAERIVLHGSKDQGDLRIKVNGLVIAGECKWRNKYPNDAEEKDFRRQTDTEAANAGADCGVLFVNRYRMSISRHEVWMRMSTACLIANMPVVDAPDVWTCMRLDDFCWLAFGLPEGN